MRIPPSELGKRIDRLTRACTPCRLCPNACAVDRRQAELGRCGVGVSARVASFGPHFGEERPLVGRFGSGTVFFSGCNLACRFCQNWRISQEREGVDVSDADLAGIFLRIQEAGCHNLNLVTPTPHAASIARALAVAINSGFALPIVWNCGGYESIEVLRCLDGIVDVYMPDVKYGDDTVAMRLSGVADYALRSRAAVREMHRQVGDLEVDDEGIARLGLLVRHLVLPERLAGTKSVMRFLAEEISQDTYVNVMGQYRPCHRAAEVPTLRRRITTAEHEEAIALAKRAGLRRFAQR
jgi:putative pyruvate formate lyase activating enzyme